MSGEVNRYKTLILKAISTRWLVPPNADKNRACRFQIQLGAHGVVQAVVLIQSSGDVALDRSAQAAIYKASPLPVPQDRDLFETFKSITLTVRPEAILSNGQDG